MLISSPSILQLGEIKAYEGEGTSLKSYIWDLNLGRLTAELLHLTLRLYSSSNELLTFVPVPEHTQYFIFTYLENWRYELCQGAGTGQIASIPFLSFLRRCLKNVALWAQFGSFTVCLNSVFLEFQLISEAGGLVTQIS